MSSSRPLNLPYDPRQLPRELVPYYIPAGASDIEQMLKEIGATQLADVFGHIPREKWFDGPPDLGPSFPYEELVRHMEGLAAKNKIKTSFIGDGLKNYKVPEIVNHVSRVRGLTTAYTPYQPERSQGTLTSLWIYSSLMSMLTGFEAVNASLYDRSTCLVEAINCARRLSKGGAKRVLVLESLYPGDVEVVKTHAWATDLIVHTLPVDPATGVTNLAEVRKRLEEFPGEWVGLAYPQINSLGNLEDVDALTDLAYEFQIQAIAVIDPITLATGALRPPSQFGHQGQGAHMLVGEGQHLAIAPNFGGPGLGVFGIRYREKNAKDTMTLRSTPGRFVGLAKDEKGRECRSLVLSTREQHIRREKATSNICSNQSFVATLVGAAILDRGEEGMTRAVLSGYKTARKMAAELTGIPGVKLAFPKTPFFNEFVLELPLAAADLIKKASAYQLQIGVDVSSRTRNSRGNHLLLSFFDLHGEKETQELLHFFEKELGKRKEGSSQEIPTVPEAMFRTTPVNLPHFPTQVLKDYYEKLGEQNISPDDVVYPLGSCTMKYNPYINDYAAGLPGFQMLHPQSPVEDAQGSLEILYGIQEMFKKITGLAAVTTQPMAGAQGELVGLKIFQAYFADKGELSSRKIVLIPATAHGTNPASATMAGLLTKDEEGRHDGIVEIRANPQGTIDLNHLTELVNTHGKRILGVMVTNPNTSGLFETQFREMSDLIHSVGGLVYMDGANMNAIAGWLDLKKMGVDAVHNNLHKTWTIPHGGGGPGDAIVAVAAPLAPYLPGWQVEKIQKDGDTFFQWQKPARSIGSFHRHYGNFAHKVRCYTYLKALGTEGVRKMAAVACLSSRYLFQKLQTIFPTLPENAGSQARMHEFIITLSAKTFEKIEMAGIPRAQIIAKIGKLFLDFGVHTPTVAFPEVYGLMIEPTESYTKEELDRFADVVKAIHLLINETPEVLLSVPHFTPVDRIDEVTANKNPVLWAKMTTLPEILPNRLSPRKLGEMSVGEICKEILNAHKNSLQRRGEMKTS